MRYRSLFIFLSLCGAILISGSGCNKVKRPDGMPALHPTTFTFTQDGAPLPDATVTLISEDGANSLWPSGGTTNGAGVLKVKTMSQFDGAPAGKFKIVISKTETEGTGTSGAESDDPGKRSVAAAAKFYNLVEAPYRSASTTPLNVEITPGKNTKTFEAGKAVREQVITGD